PDPDPGLLRALQGAVRHNRDAACAVLRLDPRSVRAGPDLAVQPVRSDPVGPAILPYAWRLAPAHGHHHVPADAHEPDSAGPHAGHDLHLDAGGFHLPAGLVPGWPRDLLGVEQLPVDPAAGLHHE